MACKRFANNMGCSLCMEIYTVKEKVPKNLICGHTFCIVCLEFNRPSKVKLIQCPTCKVESTVPSSGIKGLGTNHSIIALLDLLCHNCLKFGDTGKCPDCAEQLCQECRDVHKIEHYTIRIVTILEKVVVAKDRVSEKMRNIIGECDAFLVKARGTIQNASKLEEIQTVEDQAKLHINKMTNLLRTLDTSHPGAKFAQQPDARPVRLNESRNTRTPIGFSQGKNARTSTLSTTLDHTDDEADYN